MAAYTHLSPNTTLHHHLGEVKFIKTTTKVREDSAQLVQVAAMQ